MGSPTQLRADAQALRVEAARIAPALHGATRVASTPVWAGPGGDRTVAELWLRGAQLGAIADDLTRRAAALEAQADALEAELRAAAEAERRRAELRLAAARGDGTTHAGSRPDGSRR